MTIHSLLSACLVALALPTGQEALKPAQQELLAQPVVLPGPFLNEAVAGFGANVSEYGRCIEELETVLAAATLQDGPPGAAPDLLTALPTVVSNLHDYFVAVAAKLERTHAEVERAKTAYTTRLRARGVLANPFERAARAEAGVASGSGTAATLRTGALASAAVTAAPGGGAQQGALMPASGAAAAGSPATPALPGFGGAPFGSPFVSTATPGAFGAPAGSGGLSRSSSKTRSGKKR